MCEAPQTGSDLRRVFDWIECKWLHKKEYDVNEIEKDLQILKDLIVKNSDDSKLVIYIKNKAIMKEASYKLDILTPIILSFVAFVLTVLEFYENIVNDISECLNNYGIIGEHFVHIAGLMVPFLLLAGCIYIIIGTGLKHRHDSRAKKFYAICLNTLWPQLPPKNEVNNSQNLKCSVKTNTKHKKNKK